MLEFGFVGPNALVADLKAPPSTGVFFLLRVMVMFLLGGSVGGLIVVFVLCIVMLTF